MTQCHDDYETDPLVSARFPILVRDVMTQTAIKVDPTATVKEIAHVMLSHDVRALPVVDIGDVLVGLVSEADVICRECATARHHTLGGFVDRLIGHGPGWADKADGITAEEIMSIPVISCTPTEPVAVAARRMLAEEVRILPVVKDGKLVGVVSRHDMLRMFDRPDPEIRARIDRLLADPLWAPEGHHVHTVVVDGVVKLTGTVRDPRDAWVVVSEIGEVPGVIAVENHLSAESKG